MKAAVSTYADVVRLHASRAVLLCRDRLGELERLAGFAIAPDGSNGARSAEDVERCVRPVETVAGPVAAISARLLLRRAATEAGLQVNL